MAADKLEVTVRFAWWLRPYLWGLLFFCQLHRCDPDWVKLHRVVMRALRIDVGRADA
jgi:hypothetical protein